VAGLPEDAAYELTSGDDLPHCTSCSPGRNLVLRLRGLRRRAPAAAAASDESFLSDLFTLTLLIQPDKVLSSADVALESVRQLRQQLSDSVRSGEAAFASPGALVAQLVEYVLDDATRLVNALQDEARRRGGGARAAHR